MNEEEITNIRSKPGVQKQLTPTRMFTKLRVKLEDDLKKTGFDPSLTPPIEEPKVTENTSKLNDSELKSLYDCFIVYYDFLTDQITRCEVYLETTKKRVEIVKSELTLQSMNEPSLANAEARKAWVEAHEAHLVVLFDYLYFKQLYAAQEQRRKKMSKSMDRIYREIMSRDVPNRGTYYGDNKPQFRQVRRPSV